MDMEYIVGLMVKYMKDSLTEENLQILLVKLFRQNVFELKTRLISSILRAINK